jgi:hypothetical protein
MATIAERIPSTWFDRPVLSTVHSFDKLRMNGVEGLTMTGHPELVEGCCNVCANN